jgi:hypothetical protein
MKYIYVFSLEKFERNAEDEILIRAWKNGEAERYTVEDFAELINDDDFCDVNNWVRAMDDDEGFFEISCLHRDDLEGIGYDTSRVDDSDMKKLASKLGDDYCEQLFWNSLPILADVLGIPKQKDNHCALEEELDSWWGALGFDEMKRITGLDCRDFSPVDGYQEYVDVSGNLWREKSIDEKLEIYNH